MNINRISGNFGCVLNNIKGKNPNSGISANTVNYLKPLSRDTVSFSARAKFADELPENVKTASEFGRKLYEQLSLNPENTDLISFVSQNSSKLTVLPLSELGENSYCAYYTKDVLNDGTSVNQKMYINNDTSDINDNLSAMLRTMEIAHEYTHFLQDNECSEIELLSQMSDNPLYTYPLCYMSNMMFKYYDNELQANTVLHVFNNYHDKKAFEKYNRIVPSKRNITKEDLIAGSPLKTEENFNNVVNEKFDSEFNKIKQQLITHPQSKEEEYCGKFFSFMDEQGKTDELKQNIRKLISLAAKKEVEAYTTEANLARDFLKTRKTINLDAFPIYYSLIAEAFSK